MPRSASNPLKFQAQLVVRGPGGAWTYLAIPFNVQEVFGRKGQVPVRATINGFTFRNSLMPRAGVHILGVGKDILAAAGAAESAKKPETRQKRVEKAIEMLAARKTPKG